MFTCTLNKVNISQVTT